MIYENYSGTRDAGTILCFLTKKYYKLQKVFRFSHNLMEFFRQKAVSFNTDTRGARTIHCFLTEKIPQIPEKNQFFFQFTEIFPLKSNTFYMRFNY